MSLTNNWFYRGKMFRVRVWVTYLADDTREVRCTPPMTYKDAEAEFVVSKVRHRMRSMHGAPLVEVELHRKGLFGYGTWYVIKSWDNRPPAPSRNRR
jgi:hypothetical protein